VKRAILFAEKASRRGRRKKGILRSTREEGTAYGILKINAACLLERQKLKYKGTLGIKSCFGKSKKLLKFVGHGPKEKKKGEPYLRSEARVVRQKT